MQSGWIDAAKAPLLAVRHTPICGLVTSSMQPASCFQEPARDAHAAHQDALLQHALTSAKMRCAVYMRCSTPWHLCREGGKPQAGLWLAIDLPPQSRPGSAPACVFHFQFQALTSAERFCPTDTIVVAPRATRRVVRAAPGPPRRPAIRGATKLAAIMPPAVKGCTIDGRTVDGMQGTQPRFTILRQRTSILLRIS